MSANLILVHLSPDQVERAKAANGPRLKITHALICSGHGQIFGTEKQCRKYFSVWREIFLLIFPSAVETASYEIVDYNATFSLVIRLLEANDALANRKRR